MRVEIRIDHKVKWGEEVRVVSSLPQIGLTGFPLICENESEWSVSVNIDRKTTLKYSFLVADSQGNILKKESGEHFLKIESGENYVVNNLWQSKPDAALHSSPFKECFFKHSYKQVESKGGALLKVKCLEVEVHQSLAVLGEGILGDWNVEKALYLTPIEYGLWEISLPITSTQLEYKLAVIDMQSNTIVRWEEGENRVLYPSEKTEIRVEELSFRNGLYRWKGAGVAIPVFSLRTKNSFGVGEFSDIKEMVDWASSVGMRIVQVLPVNDTSMTGTWKDSYPYNAISIYALHPIYLGLQEYPLREKKKMSAFLEQKKQLEKLEVLDYEQVIKLKREYIHLLFEERGTKTSSQKAYQTFISNNENWLFPYASFSYLRDKNATADYRRWGKYAVYDKSKLEKLQAKDTAFQLYLDEVYFTQYLLQKQLKEVRKYALNKGVVLKGDIPIGISRDSVEAWVEPHLFNLDTQTGAPPDDFSVEGQNWGFPTYNWEEMSKDGYQWWQKRFRKMAEYFDVYRIDHILGFFRIWEIPLDAVQGLLGYFSPALPFSIEDIQCRGLCLSEERMLSPFINTEILQKLFDEKADDVKQLYLNQTGDGSFYLKEEFNSQRKIKQVVAEDDMRNKLYALCANVLFIRDKKQPEKFHPRISAQKTSTYEYLSYEEKHAFDAIYEDFFFKRHSEFWKGEAMKKLPPLISSTKMLVCGEDLGMIPASVPKVMKDLDILSLEIQRMPKMYGTQFENLSKIPYKSVCATSTHDMAPIRLWWKEDRDRTQFFYNNVLNIRGEAPYECNPELCEMIIKQHLDSPAMLSIHPLQDWLAMDASVRRANEVEERINVPADSNHYWQYRMHLNVEEMKNVASLNNVLSKIMLNLKRACNERE